MQAVSHAQNTSLMPEEAQARKIMRAATDFEAVLLNSLLGSLEQTFASLPGEKLDSGSDHYHYLGMQALTSSLASRGGLGFKDLIVRGLMKRGDSGVGTVDKKASQEVLLSRGLAELPIP